MATKKEVRNGRLAKMIESVDSDVYQWRYAGSATFFNRAARDTIPLMKTSVPRMKRMARSRRRGVGMNATGSIMIKMVFGMSKVRVTAVCLWNVAHCELDGVGSQCASIGRHQEISEI